MAIYIGRNKIGAAIKVGKEDLDLEIKTQETLLNEVEEAVNDLTDKPTDMLQQIIDQSNTCANMCSGWSKITNLDFLNKLDVSEVTNLSGMCKDCSNLESIDLTSWDTSNVTDMNNMFYYCKKLTTVGDISKWNTSKVTKIYSMFNNCQKLTSLDLSRWDLSKVTEVSSMFATCYALTDVNLGDKDTSLLTSMSSMFNNAYAIQSVDFSGWNTSNVTSMDYMFQTTYALTTIKGLDMYSVTSFNNMFKDARKITNVELKNIRKSGLILGSGTKYGHLLTNESLINIIKELWDYSSGTSTYSITLSTTSKTNIQNIYVKLVDVTDEMLAKDPYAGNKKPCVVCESTDEGAMTLTEYATSKKWSIG